MKKIELIKQNTYEKKNKQNTIPEALISTKQKHMIKEEPIQRMEQPYRNGEDKIRGKTPHPRPKVSEEEKFG